MFIKTTICSALAGLAASAPAPRAEAEGFAMIAIHSGNQLVHQRGINAYQEGLYINKDTQAYCPPDPACASSTSPLTSLLPS